MVSINQFELGSPAFLPLHLYCGPLPFKRLEMGKCCIRVGASQPVSLKISIISFRTWQWEKTLILRVNQTVHRLLIHYSQMHLVFYIEFYSCFKYLWMFSQALTMPLEKQTCFQLSNHSLSVSSFYFYKGQWTKFSLWNAVPRITDLLENSA